MSHWTDPDRRGVYDHPAAPPPRPMPREANDVNSRQARMEEHISFAAWDRRRIEVESRSRASDLVQLITVLRQDVVGLRKEIQADLAPILRYLERKKHKAELIASWRKSLLSYIKYIVISLLGLATLAGQMSVEKATLLGKWIGFG